MNTKLLVVISFLSGLSIIASELYTSRSDCLLTDGTHGTIYELSMGDWSCDGHCIEQFRNVCSNLTQEEIQAAYAAATEKIAFDFIEEVATDYEDSSLPASKLKILRDNGVANWTFEDEEYLEEGETLDSVSLDANTYSEIYLQLVRLGNSNFKYETLRGKTLRIGGYGLFSQ